ncbi:MAG TPA: hypothetical protein PKA27_12300 [Fimbriimonadaceae bacterium]|nr:hypothetical protein [Fimbriimonadaceae bacterium]
MRITNYETNKPLSAVGLDLTPQEAEELAVYLRSLVAKPEVRTLFLSELDGNEVAREVSIHLILPTAHNER